MHLLLALTLLHSHGHHHPRPHRHTHGVVHIGTPTTQQRATLPDGRTIIVTAHPAVRINDNQLGGAQ